MAQKKVIVDQTKIVALNKPNKLVEMHAREFSIDLKVQRTLNEARAEKMAEDFRPEALGLLTASRRADGHVYVLDGGHRVSAARKAHYDGLIATRLFEDLTIEEEAQLFLTLNNMRAVQAIDHFKVRITQGEKQAVGINNVLKRYGLHVDWRTTDRNVIGAIGALEWVFNGLGIREHGDYPDLVEDVIRTLHRAYGRDTQGTYSKIVLESLGILFATFGKRIDNDHLVDVLQGTVPKQIAAQVKALQGAKVMKGRNLVGGTGALVLHRMYNNRYKNKLPEFHAVEPKNAAYHMDRLKQQEMEQDPLYVDNAEFVRPEVEEALAREHQDA